MAEQERATARQDCGSTVESDKSPIPSVLKRPRGSPTLCTPYREEKRVPLREVVASDSNEIPRVALFNRPSMNTAPEGGSSDSTKAQMEKWAEEELQALTEFVLFHTTGDKWPAHKQPEFWRAASDFMKQRLGTGVGNRSASACRSRVVRFLSKRFRTPAEAGAYFNDQKLPSQACASSLSYSMKSSGMQTDPIDSSMFLGILNLVPRESRLPLLSEVFSAYMLTMFKLSVPNDFLHLAASAMLQLSNNGRTNVLYNLAKGMGTLRQDKEDSRFPIKCMPMGLVEYTAQFFAFDSLQQVTCPMDYRQWLQTMYCNFGEKWIKLHRGPMWCATTAEQGFQGASGPMVCKQRTMEALVNVPAISARSIRSHIATCKTTLDSQIQLNVLDEAVRHNPNAWWWIKADGCDINKGLKESSRLEWSGDVDLADGLLLEKYKTYRKQLETAENIGLCGDNVVQELANVLDTISKDLDFLQSQIIKFNNAYSEKLQSHVQKEKDLITLSWKVKELTELNQNGRQLHRDATSLISKLEEHAEDNIPYQLCSFRHKLVSFIKGVSRHQRTPATHILVFMISTEDRRRKPYALPIQCIPYVGLSDAKIRELANKIITEMVKRKMNVAGFTTDGEWNSLRMKGNMRPLSIFQIRADSRAKFSQMGLKRMLKMITVVRSREGNISAALYNPAISGELLGEIDSWCAQGATVDDVIERLRLRTVPPGYTIHSWVEGKDETKAEKLRSILAQLEYKHQIDAFNAKGIPFRNHLYVPEIHPVTQTGFCEREDEGHVLKRIGQSLRHGGPHNIHLERFEEALHDTAAGLTYPALSGIRKQSVEDVERLFGPSLILWMENKGYHHEAEYLKHVRNWRRACDERGLTDDQRSELNAGLLNYILDDLMPWHKDDGSQDFSLLEVNRSISGVRGFSRETLVALVANIESREWRKKFNSERGVLPEHPRASTTDDVECFFSLLRDCVGKDFTLKEVFYGWRKVTEEFMKRMDPELPFYYHTSKHSRYYEGVMPEFSVQPVKTKPKKLPRYELLGENNRITFSVRGDSSIRAQFHNIPVDLPPLPGTHNPCTREHSYAMTHQN